jgi:hypothetical protein
MTATAQLDHPRFEAAEEDEARSGEWRLVTPLEEARAALHLRPFWTAHALEKHPLFRLEALLRVAQDAARRRGDVYMDAGDIGIGDKWGQVPVPDMPVDEVLRRIEHAGAWIVMKHVEADPAYAGLLREWADFMRGIAGDGAHLLRNPEMLVIINSPRRITPFHFDAEVNVLVQIHGYKSLWVCDPNDRSVVAETDIEHYYGVSIAAANYKPHAEKVAQRFDLEPGDAVHIPSHAAHWVRNGDQVSVSLSLNFELPRWYRRDVYLANRYLRRLGIEPRPPGQSRLRDGAKAATMATARAVRGLAKRRP